MKKKTKKKSKQKKRKFKRKIKRLKKIIKTQKKHRILKKIKKRAKTKKFKKKAKIKFKLLNINVNNVRIPQFKAQRKKLKKITFQKVLDFLLEPIFKAYENFKEKRKLEKLKKIAIEKKEREREIKEERRFRYEAKQKELRDEIRLAKGSRAFVV